MIARFAHPVGPAKAHHGTFRGVQPLAVVSHPALYVFDVVLEKEAARWSQHRGVVCVLNERKSIILRHVIDKKPVLWHTGGDVHRSSVHTLVNKLWDFSLQLVWQPLEKEAMNAGA